MSPSDPAELERAVPRAAYPWAGRRVLVTGGCSFIGSHLVEALLAQGVRHLRVVDDLSTGKLANLAGPLAAGQVELIQADLLADGRAREAVKDIDVVFHLAAIHGGRGFIDLNQAKCARNLTLDGIVIDAAYQAGVEKFVFASSGCVYPVELQSDVNRTVYLSEDMVGPPFSADGMYGWAKLMAEETLRAYHKDFGFKSVSCRFFTAYGERCLESHAIIAMIGRAFLKLDPFEVWGDGTQIRNWTYVGDIVDGMIRAAEVVDDGSAINLGTEEPTRVIDAARQVLALAGHQAEIKLLTDMPTGPLNRVASNQVARERLGLAPRWRFADGLRRTLEWYFATHQAGDVAEGFERKLVER
ncbi:MAG: galE [Cyanobacteria bacterium RYN_339]|nr:galE [Cyanobacteria bacterium RYN_339]